MSGSIAAFSAASQLPVHVRTKSTNEHVADPQNGSVTSRVLTYFEYGAYGNATSTAASTFQDGSTPVASVLTINAYDVDNAAKWRLGRLTRSTVVHSRPNATDRVRVTAFEYAMSGPSTGLLTAEITEPEGAANIVLRKQYGYDDYGNRTAVQTCNSATACAAGISFHPSTPTAVNRYSRVAYGALGQYPATTYEPFWNGSGASESITSTVLTRDVFGNPTQGFDVNGVDTVASTGSMGRPYYTWTEVQPGSTPGASGLGVETFTTYRICESGTPCPEAARYREQVTATGAPTQWTYFDVLGRPILKAVQTFNQDVSGKDVSAVCTDYDQSGKPFRVSNPFFLAGLGVQAVSGVCGSSERLWTTTTSDLLGRPVSIQTPAEVSGFSTTTITYSGRSTTTTNPRSQNLTTTKKVNGKGEIAEVIDAGGLSTKFWYYADGSNYAITRDAGRGSVENRFDYDVLGRKVVQTDQDSGTTWFVYNALGELVKQTDAEGNTVENEIDARGRVWRRTVKDSAGTVESQSTFTFDTAANGLGKPASESISGSYIPWNTIPSMALSHARAYSYDALGRAVQTTTTIEGATYPGAVAYDWAGRPFRSQDATGQWAKAAIDSRGFTRALCPSGPSDNTPACDPSAAWQRIDEADVWGHVLKEYRSPTAQLTVSRLSDARTGRTQSICADKPGTGGNCDLVDEQYGWDFAGNLSTRLKDSRYRENFTYDGLDRLTHAYVVSQNGAPANLLTHWHDYDPLGNICAKIVAGNGTNLGYDGRACSGAQGTGNNGAAYGAHRVNRIYGGPFDGTLAYDGRGNQTYRDATNDAYDRTIRYSADSKPYAIVDGLWGTTNKVTRYWYGADGQRYKRETLADGKFTHYVGNVEIIRQGSVVTYKRIVGGILLQTIVGKNTTSRYLFHDQLGSLVRTSDEAGTVADSLDYNPDGERRDYANVLQTGAPSPSLTPRGFTGHEHVSNDVIHMNGRLYDPVIGRFLQPDPVIQAADSAQSWNAYSYVFNNPLKYTDPTGLWGRKEQQALRTAIAIAITVWSGGSGAAAGFGATATGAATTAGFFASAVYGGFAAGVVGSNGSLKQGLYGAFGAAIFFGVGSYFQSASWASSGTHVFGSGLNAVGYAAKVAGHAIAGGILAELQGGRFGDGFIGAGVAELFAPMIDRIGGGAPETAGLRVAAAAVLGGTASVLSGGKFANGALSAAFSRAFNAEAHLGQRLRDKAVLLIENTPEENQLIYEILFAEDSPLTLETMIRKGDYAKVGVNQTGDIYGKFSYREGIWSVSANIDKNNNLVNWTFSAGGRVRVRDVELGASLNLQKLAPFLARNVTEQFLMSSGMAMQAGKYLMHRDERVDQLVEEASK